eukprot:scaffold137277_cov21-Prasinocladus_malaysianus.AAC.1
MRIAVDPIRALLSDLRNSQAKSNYHGVNRTPFQSTLSMWNRVREIIEPSMLSAEGSYGR